MYLFLKFKMEYSMEKYIFYNVNFFSECHMLIYLWPQLKHMVYNANKK